VVHRSYLHENPDFGFRSNERLEYLGDAVIELIVSDYLYHNYPEATEGELTAMRAALVRAPTLARIARGLGLGELLYLSRGEIEAGARTRNRQLAQALEAVVGAVYLDQGSEVARELTLRLLAPEIAKLAQEQFVTDAKSRLQELAQATTGAAPVYVVIAATGPGHRPHFVVEARLGDQVLGTGEGHRKRDAEQLAARDALARYSAAPPA
jgi:ribonuclease-3